MLQVHVGPKPSDARPDKQEGENSEKRAQPSEERIRICQALPPN